jgi:hypothetical protein
VTQEAAVPASLIQQIKRMIDEGVAAGLRSAPNRNSQISSGGTFTVNGGRFQVLYPSSLGSGSSVYVGDLYSGGSYAGTGLLAQDSNGTDMLMARHDTASGTQRVEMYDSGNRIIVGNDANSQQGLARPYLPAAFYRKRYADMSVSTTSATFETLWESQIHKQHPRYEVGVRASMDTPATTGELQVLVNGVALGSAAAQSFAVVSNVFGPVAVAGTHMSVLTVEIQGRVTSGSGALRVEPQYLVGRQS